MLRIRELTLAGFGVYEHPTRFLIPDGPAVLWGANETGKSTFLWGIASVWFGLPQSSDPSKVGTSRFRSFSRPDDFWGELVWERDGRTYRLRRDFDRHKVCLTEESESGVIELFHGEHNPAGRSSAGTAFPDLLRQAIGLGSMETFLGTFCLTQPFVGDAAVESELQHLISGSRTARTDDVLAHLFAEIKTLTKNTGDLALVRPGTSRPTNQREEGRLEQLQGELARARLDLELGRKHLEQIHTEGLGLRETEEEAEQLRSQIAERERRLKALTRWTELQDERNKRSETVHRLEGSLDELDALDADRARLSGDGDARATLYATAPADAAERLEALERAERARLASEAQEQEHQAGRERLQGQISEVEARLSADYADVRGRRDWIDVRNRLREAVARAEQVEAEVTRLAEEAARRERDLENTEGLDRTEVTAGRANATVLLEAHDRVTRIETKLAALRKQAVERSTLEDAGRRALLQEAFELEQESKEQEALVREKRAAVVLAKDLLAEAEERRVRRDADATLVVPPPTAEPEPADLEPEPTPTIASWPSPEAPAGPPAGALPVLALLLGAAATLVLAFGIGLSLPTAIGIGLAVAAASYLVLGRIGTKPRAKAAPSAAPSLTPGERLRRRLEETRSEITSPAPEVEDPEALARLRSALEEAETQLSLALAREAETAERLAEIRSELGELAGTTAAELARLEERWKLLDEQIEALQAERAEILEERFGTNDDHDWHRTPVSETTEALEALLLLPGGPSPEDHPTLDDLLAWLTRLDEADWDAFQDAQTAREDAVAELRDVQRRLRHAEERRPDRREIAELEARFQPFSLETDPKWLLSHQEECEELERQLARLQSQLEAMGPAARPVRDRDLATELWNALALDWPALRGPAMDRRLDEPLHEWTVRARRQLAEVHDQTVRTASIDEAAPRILRSAGVRSREELTARLAAERSALGLAVRDLETLERTEIALADERALDGTDRATQLARRRSTEIDALEQDREALDRVETALRERLRERATLEGREIPNLATLELRIRTLDHELEETRFRCDALTQAYRWAEEATGSFQSTYRESLGERIDQHFARLTGVTARRVELGETFALRVRDPQGRLLEPEQLSQGARDQLLLAMRLGMADLLSDAVPLPFLFDDPFVHFDEGRLTQLRGGLEALGTDRQWILLTHRKEMSRWADPVFTDGTLEDVPHTATVGAPHRPAQAVAAAPALIRLVEADPVAAAGPVSQGPASAGADPEADTGTEAEPRRARRSPGRKDDPPPASGSRQGKLFDLWGRS